VEHWIGLPRTRKRGGRKALQPMIGQLQPGMLAGDKQSRCFAKGGQGMCDWT